ncbi:MAG TPA: hypothetical protein VI456_15060, partial [Polyangia bacterium]
MSIEARAFPMPDPETETLSARDLFVLGRPAAAARDASLGRRGSFVRARQILASGGWRGPRDAAESYVDEADLGAVGGLEAACAAGIDLFVGAPDAPTARAAAQAGLRVLLRFPYRLGES